ncbi:hypothetical protein B484DRAFT_479390 [Ochromonadaceae sp. CCMP2298]|nr:hypothetical protein B484DRAFT_479390 [Ochromonadaceae sp. CCMP2298]
MNRYCSELVLNHERLATTCYNLKATGKHPGVSPGYADNPEHPDFGVDRFCILQSIAVIQGGFGAGSRFQSALFLRFSATDNSKITLADFGDPKTATTTIFEAGRTTQHERGVLCGWLGNFQLFLGAFSGPAFLTSLDSLIKSLTNDFALWFHFHNLYLLVQLSLMLLNFGSDINTQEKSDLLPDLVLSTSESNALLLETYGKLFVSDACTLNNGWTKNGHFNNYSLDVGQHHDIVHRQLGAPAPALAHAPASAAVTGLKRDLSETGLPADRSKDAAKRAKSQARLACAHHVAGKIGVKDSSSTFECGLRRFPETVANFKLSALRNSFVAASSVVMPHNLLEMGNVESKCDDYNELPGASWTDGWRFHDVEEEQQAAMDVIAEEEVAAAIEERTPELLRLEDCALEAEEEERDREEWKRQSHNRAKDLWGTTWGRLLLDPKLNEPKSWEHRTFVRRFRLPYQLFKQLVVQATEVNLFNQQRQGKIPLEFKLLIGLRILGRDACADDLDEALNIGGSTINNIFKQFVTGMATKLYDRHVHVPQGEEQDRGDIHKVSVYILLSLF